MKKSRTTMKVPARTTGSGSHRFNLDMAETVTVARRRVDYLPGSALTSGVAALAVAGLADAVLRHERGTSGDEPFYLAMAAHPGRPHSFPYAYRVLVPWLVHVLPFPEVVSFQLLALLCTAAAAAVLHALLRDFDVPAPLAGALAVGFAVSPTLLVVLLRHGRGIDPATALTMMLGCLFIVRRRRLELAVTLALGVAVKETALFLVPLTYAVWARRPLDRQALRDTALVAAAPVATYLALRAGVSAVGNRYTPEFTGSWLQVRVDNLRQAFSGVELRRLAYTYGPVWIAAPLALRTLPFARRGLVLVVVCLLALTVSFDSGRILFLAAPVFYVAAAVAVRDRPRWAVALVLALLATDAGYAAYMQVHGVRAGLDSARPSAIRVY
jgi:hypothetical protein